MTYIDDAKKEATNFATKRTMPDKNSDLRYKNMKDNLDTLYRNTAIPDETFGPDEERIFIDVDPYDLDESIFGLQHNDPVKITPVVIKDRLVTPAKSDVDYVEESLKNVKRQWHDKTDVKNHWSSTPKNQNKESINLATSSENIGLEMYYVPDSNIKHNVEKFEESHDKNQFDRKNYDSIFESGHASSTISLKETDIISKKPDIDDEEMKVLNRTEEYGYIFEEEMKKRKVHVENDTDKDSITRETTTRDLEDDLIDLARMEDREPVKIEKNIKNLSRNQEDRNNSSEDVNNEEIQKTNKSLDTTTIAFIEPNVTTDSTIPSLSVLGK